MRYKSMRGYKSTSGTSNGIGLTQRLYGGGITDCAHRIRTNFSNSPTARGTVTGGVGSFA